MPIADLLTIEPSLSIFYSYARELGDIARMLEGPADRKLTVLAPTNKAVMALARKPHQSQELEEKIEISEQEFSEKSTENVRRWVGSHVIPAAVDMANSQSYDTLVEGKAIEFACKESGRPEDCVLDNDVHISGVREASNGVIYIISSTIEVD
ncbi:hypothetical protein CYLTODRAFT_347327 [Cylindrobasidium torrendii FP15055 ss-10]|uniref:FAS1 domain-containing protein n=1 Tax=Cylindrobasidium torrendii FP15055 ss-10 TaxID=1314674 RepID=A0A0D7BJS0_9AGAR|nr:hypothetical protein CYLTODRAFT_347327 [Cylindrobasidium torrendii FP15055 ss-10]